MLSLGPACLGGGGSNNKPPATLPSAPTTLLANPFPTTARIDLTWIDTADNEFEFRIERSDDGGTTWAQVGAVPKNTLGYTDLGLLPGTTYAYRVAAWNGEGYSTFAGPSFRDTKALTWNAGSLANGPGIGKAWHSAIYDSADVRMVVFGGIDDFATILNEVWSYNLSGSPAGDWASLGTTGTPPLPRYGHSAVYDPANHRMVVFGGIAEVPPNPPQHLPQNDVHILDLTTLAWSQPLVTGTPPSPRAFHSAVYDSDNERMIVYGGKGNGPAKLTDVHYLSLAGTTPFAWSSPGLGAQPVGREQHSSIFDPLGSRMILFAGLDNEPFLDGSLFANDTWTLTAFGWKQLTFTGTPGFRMGHTAVYDAANQRMVVFGGNDTTAPTATSEMWGLKLHTTAPSWTILDPTSGSPPPPRFGHSAVYDIGSNRMIIYGGYDDFGTALDEVWIVEL